ncbi:MAG: MBL fold metallo-hydrolase [Puniceicoccales bacterium]|jgi:glyoxylase-like metal-dependent hydrolase (beta-lactamase superfamily II)|nr:MBL fold metallo-hydrolase [Puniceicoccales bacterium]
MRRSKFLVTSNKEIQISVAKCGPIGNNAGFIENAKRREAVLIDAPFGAFEASKNILSPEAKVVAILFTHGHWDHMGDGNMFKNSGTQTYAHRLDKLFIEHPELVTMLAGSYSSLIPCKIDFEVEDNDAININGWLEVFCRWIPGHAAGDLAFYIKSLGCVFTGDTLFKGNIGRSDLPGGNESLLISGVKEKLLTLPQDTVVIPGHGSFTTISKEKNSNPYLN